MTSIIKFEPLSGVWDEGPLAHILQIDDFTFLLDCGWDENFSIQTVKSIKNFAHKIDAVLITYPDLYHLGALPYLVGKCGLTAPIYATIPVYKMGQMFMYDIYQSKKNNEEFELFSLDDVDSAFDRITQLKYSQTVGLKSKGHGLEITAIPAGHMIGGTIWKIVKDGEEEIIYAVDFNHKKERHLNGCQILENLSLTKHASGGPTRDKPCSLLITDAMNSGYEQSRRRLRDELLITRILKTLRDEGGNVLLPIDTAGRVLEIAHLLDQLWRNPDSGLSAYPLVFLNNVSYNVVAFAQNQIEWMSEKISKITMPPNNSVEQSSVSPFHFKHLTLCHNLSDLERISSPKVVLASSPGLDSGYSRDLFIEWCANAKNTIILTSRTTPGTLARTLIDDTTGMIKTLTLEVKKRVKLQGYELQDYYRRQKRASNTRLNTESFGRSSTSDHLLSLQKKGMSSTLHASWRKHKKRLNSLLTNKNANKSTQDDKSLTTTVSKTMISSDGIGLDKHQHVSESVYDSDFSSGAHTCSSSDNENAANAIDEGSSSSDETGKSSVSDHEDGGNTLNRSLRKKSSFKTASGIMSNDTLFENAQYHNRVSSSVGIGPNETFLSNNKSLAFTDNMNVGNPQFLGNAENGSSTAYDVYINNDIYLNELDIVNYKKYRKRLICFAGSEQQEKSQKLKWDDYGESVDPNEFNFQGVQQELSALDIALRGNPNPNTTQASDQSLNSPTFPSDHILGASEVPTKCISTPRTLSIRASIVFIDFEGKSDGESYKKIIAQIKPKQLVLVHGTEKCTSMLADYFRSHPALGISSDKIFTPKLGEVVNATLETRIFKVKIKDALASQLRFSKYRGIELAELNSSIVTFDAEVENDEQKKTLQNDNIDANYENEEVCPSLDVEYSSSLLNNVGDNKNYCQKAGKSNNYFVGDLKLTDFKQILIANGFNQVEFLGPTLVCNELIAIRKNEQGKVSFEGPMCRDYFKIRDIFYQQFAIL